MPLQGENTNAALGRQIVSRKGAKAQRKRRKEGKKEKAGKYRLELASLSETCKHPNDREAVADISRR
jgi:hypothetical protein